MTRMFKGLFVILAVVAVLAGIGAALYLSLTDAPTLRMPVMAAAFLAVLTPFSIIAIRHQVRRTRIRLIDIFANNFGLEDAKGRKIKDFVSFEFVKGKYYADLDSALEERDWVITKVPRFPMMLHADWMLLFCALPYMVFTGFGLFLLFAPVEAFMPGGAIHAWLRPGLLAMGGLDISHVKDVTLSHTNVLTVASMAVAGAYFFTLRLFLRAVAVFDLSPLTFLRAFAHIVLAVTLAVAIYRAVSGLWVTEPVGNNLPTTEGLNGIWLMVAFAFGFIPDSALHWALQKSRLTFKARYTELEAHSKLIPLTVLDGIDHFVAFRLEESNIYDVQNLATFNPIMLHVETPYGIYQSVDWIAQAQLCTVVGPERFLLLKTLNIRTIFDLERSVLGDTEADVTPDPEVQQAVAAALLMDCSRDAAMRADFALGSAIKVGGNAGPSLGAVTHLAGVMLDDLHVHRLRQVWRRIMEKFPTGNAGRVGPERASEMPVRTNGAGPHQEL